MQETSRNPGARTAERNDDNIFLSSRALASLEKQWKIRGIATIQKAAADNLCATYLLTYLRTYLLTYLLTSIM